jgi:NADPH-dependent curcumin reductase CurA
MTTNHQIVLKAYPEGVPEPAHFAAAEASVPEPGDGEYLSRTLYISLDPYVRGVITGKHMYEDRVTPGDVVIGRTVSQVVTSRHSGFAPGDIVVDANGWQQYAVSNGENVRKLDPAVAPISTAVGILGMPGLTAYAGMMYLAKPHAGETLVVSAAAGPVGTMVGQIGKIHGCRVVGIAGSDEKCAMVTEHLGFDACINYKTQDLREALVDACPDKIDIYFDNVAGDTLAAVMTRLALGARIVLCGMITQYNITGAPPPGPNLAPIVGARAHVHGLVVYDYYDRWDEFEQQAAEWFAAGKLNYKEDVAEGLAAAPEAFCRLMRGENFGKALVHVADPS